MNRKAVELGLARTRFVEFTGLDERNVSTAADCARPLRAAAENPNIQTITTTRSYEFYGHYSITESPALRSTTPIARCTVAEIRGGKTGLHLRSRLLSGDLGSPRARDRGPRRTDGATRSRTWFGWFNAPRRPAFQTN
jgi:hypothetical protein